MPTKFKQDSFTYEGRGVARKQIRSKNYIKGTPKKELFDTLNSPSAKPKLKQKCVNELTRRGIKIRYVSKKNEQKGLDLRSMR